MNKNMIDLHTHSVLSRHAYSSITENIEYAYSFGLKVYGISEHQPDNKNIGAHKYVFDNALRVVPKKYHNMDILIGIELNINPDGFDLSDIKIDELSYTIASIHSYAYPKEFNEEMNTQCYLDAIKCDYVTILGHIDNPKFKCNYEKIIKECSKYSKLIELNNASLRPQSSRIGAKDIDKQILSYCVKYKVPIIMNSDAHIKYDIGNIDFAIALLEEVNFPKELVINYNQELFNKYFKLR